MADFVLPLTSGDQANANSVGQLKSALPVLSVGVRTGDGTIPVGYTQHIDRTHSRKVDPVYQLEPYKDSIFIQGATGNTNASFGADVSYWPGERIQVVPGRIETEQVKLGRTVLYTSSLFEALMRANIGPNQVTTGDIVNGGDKPESAARFMNLLQQVRPFQIYEIYVSPIDGAIFWGIKYIDCFAKEMPRNVKTEDSHLHDEMTFEVTRSRFYTVA